MQSVRTIQANNKKDEGRGTVYVPYPGADTKYQDDHRDWKIYNPAKYRDPNWSPDKE